MRLSARIRWSLRADAPLDWGHDAIGKWTAGEGGRGLLLGWVYMQTPADRTANTRKYVPGKTTHLAPIGGPTVPTSQPSVKPAFGPCSISVFRCLDSKALLVLAHPGPGLYGGLTPTPGPGVALMWEPDTQIGPWCCQVQLHHVAMASVTCKPGDGGCLRLEPNSHTTAVHLLKSNPPRGDPPETVVVHTLVTNNSWQNTFND